MAAVKSSCPKTHLMKPGHFSATWLESTGTDTSTAVGTQGPAKEEVG